MAHGDDDEVIDFTPESGFVIEKLAASVVRMMREMDMDARVHLPGDVILEIEKECTAGEIIKGYKEYMADRISSRPASNKNEKETRPEK
jgi:hypothetical protein